jgi:endonuclease-3 related protein
VPRLVESRLALLEALDRQYGPLPPPGAGPTPLDQTFETIVRVALALEAEPKVASAAFGALRDAGLIEAESLASADPLELDDLFRERRIRLTSKALGPLRKIARWAADRGLDDEGWAELSTEAIRDAWRGLNGVGPATADALLLFALRRPTIPVRQASYRILARHGWLDPSSDYDEARSTLESIAPDNPDRLGQLALALAKLGRDSCKPTAPKCDRCPLQALLPEGGPVEGG